MGSRVIVRNCPNCGVEFKKFISVRKECCSRVCFESLLKSKTQKRKSKNCLICGNIFVPKHTKTPGLYCSYSCSGVANRKPVVMREGYRCYKGDSGEYLREHRIIMEKYTGEIFQGEVVHHINGNRKDNGINNLMLLSDSAHKRLHALGYHRLRNGVFGYG